LVRRAQATDKKLLKIGYLCSCFYQHPVGWLARWLLANHDRDRVQVYVYFVSHQVDDMLQLQYREMADVSHQFGNDGAEIADQIFQDEIDILVDLDSITLDTTCHTVSLKPAPVQATWLGWDASGLPTIDHFIADPYVLPDHAQAHYTERIWRLPHTYLAVGGFELGVPTLRRDQLDIPADAVVYLSAQRGFKRHPNTTRLQMKILAGVSNSYFLIKGQSDQGAIHAFFMEMAKAEGVDPYRLRFLPEMPLEATHRANLAIADVVLDTYPYNGATTTMETLWVGVPLVTRVGEQFVARNSYTMLKNAGIEEGIAWSDEEYVEWGIRYGTDPVLRQQVAWKLHQSRQTAPLWNAQQFTRDMEDAYEQMWQLYLESVSS
jgi:predicted O-linked N-acetylglucosamine transferase (SPINDLY family)